MLTISASLRWGVGLESFEFARHGYGDSGEDGKRSPL